MLENQIKEWVRAKMAETKTRQDDLAELLGLSQAAVSARLKDVPDTPPFKIQEIDILERHFGEPSPLRRAPPPSIQEVGIDPKVLTAVVAHMAREYPKIIQADPVLLAEAMLALCEYVQESSGRLTRAESHMAMRALLKAND
jgi:hypothetical protein